MNSLETRDIELVLAIKTWCNRFSPPEFQVSGKQLVPGGDVVASRKTVMSSVTQGSVKLSTLQTLCIISLLSFAGKL